MQYLLSSVGIEVGHIRPGQQHPLVHNRTGLEADLVGGDVGSPLWDCSTHWFSWTARVMMGGVRLDPWNSTEKNPPASKSAMSVSETHAVRSSAAAFPDTESWIGSRVTGIETTT